MITIQPRREEAIQVGYAAMGARLPAGYTLSAWERALSDWDVRAFCDGERPVGMLMTRGAELHVAVLPEVRGRWLSKRLIRETFAPILREHGQAKTKVMADNVIGLDFVRRIRAGFADLTFDPGTIALQIGGSLLTSALQGNASENAAGQAAGAANRAADLQWNTFKTINDQQAPWRQAGQQALGGIAGRWPQFNHQFNAQDLKTNLAPNYKFQLQQGQNAVRNMGNLQTGLISGNTLRGLENYTQDYAGNAYQQAFQNYNTQQSNIFNRLSTVAGLGSSANAITANAGTTAAGNAGNAMIAGGAAQAAGTVGAANAFAGGANNALGWYTLPQILNQGGAQQVQEQVPGQYSTVNQQYGG